MSELLVVVPSRGRPMNIRRLLKAFEDTAQFASLLVCVDSDDPHLMEYLALREEKPHLYYETEAHCLVGKSWTLVIEPRRRLVEILNATVPGMSRFFPALGFMGDDHVPMTPGWDAAICNALVPGPAVAYGNDGIHGETIPSACFWSADVPFHLGKIVPPELIHLYADNYWYALGDALSAATGESRRRYLPDVVIQHRHRLVGLAEDDQTYREANAGQVQEHDRAAFEQYVRDGMVTADAEFILASVSTS